MSLSDLYHLRWVYKICISRWVYKICISRGVYKICIRRWVYKICIRMWAYKICISRWAYKICISSDKNDLTIEREKKIPEKSGINCLILDRHFAKFLRTGIRNYFFVFGYIWSLAILLQYTNLKQSILEKSNRLLKFTTQTCLTCNRTEYSCIKSFFRLNYTSVNINT